MSQKTNYIEITEPLDQKQLRDFVIKQVQSLPIESLIPPMGLNISKEQWDKFYGTPHTEFNVYTLLDEFHTEIYHIVRVGENDWYIETETNQVTPLICVGSDFINKILGNEEIILITIKKSGDNVHKLYDPNDIF